MIVYLHSNILGSVCNNRKQLLYVNVPVCMAQQNSLTPETVVNGTEYYGDREGVFYLLDHIQHLFTQVAQFSIIENIQSLKVLYVGVVVATIYRSLGKEQRENPSTFKLLCVYESCFDLCWSIIQRNGCDRPCFSSLSIQVSYASHLLQKAVATDSHCQLSRKCRHIDA